MKKYKDRHLRIILKAISFCCICTAIAFGACVFICQRHRAKMREEFKLGEITHEEYIRRSIEFSDTEEKVFLGIVSGFGVTYVADVAFEIANSGKEY